MKRNFLLLLLLTLLPVAGWAQTLSFKIGPAATANTANVYQPVVLPSADPAYAVTVWTTSFTYYTEDSWGSRWEPDANTVAAGALDYDWTLLYSETETGDYLEATNEVAYKTGSDFIVRKAGFYKVRISYVAGYSYRRPYYSLNDPTEVTSSALKVINEGDNVENAIVKKFDLNVTPVNGQTKEYGEKFELTYGMITTNSEEINGNATKKAAVLSLLQLDSDLEFAPVTSATDPAFYSFGLKSDVKVTTDAVEGDDWVEGAKYQAVDPAEPNADPKWYVNRYYVKPSGRGTIIITKPATNEIVGTELYQNLIYNGQAQALFDIEAPATSTYGEPVYYVTTDEEATAETVAADETIEWVAKEEVTGEDVGTYYVFAKVVETDDYPGVVVTALGSAVISQLQPDYTADATYRPTGAAFTFDNKAHNLAVAPTAEVKAEYFYYLADKKLADDTDFTKLAWKNFIPQGTTAKDAAKFVYWYAKGNDNIKGQDADVNQYVQARFTKADVDLVIAEGNATGHVTGYKASYFYRGGDEIDNLGTPGGIVADPNTLGVTIDYYIVKVDGQLETPVEKLKDLGNYYLRAKFKGNDNVNAAELPIENCFPFAVVTPKVKITITATPNVVGVGAVPTPGYKVEWEDGQRKDKFTKAEPDYQFYRLSSTGLETPVDPSNGLSLGSYIIKADASDFATNYHEVEIVGNATFMVAPSQIEAEIADQPNLIYGQRLPLQLTYVSGYGETDTEAIEELNNTTWTNGEFVATNKETGEATQLYQWTERHGFQRVTMTTALPVGTYTVSANFTDGNQAIITKTGTWTVNPMDIDDTDQEFFVNNIGDNFDLTLTYTGEQIVPTYEDLLRIGSWNDNGISFRYQPLVGGELPEDAEEGTVDPYDYEIVGPSDPTKNINVADGGEFTLKFKGNFTGERTLKFNIGKRAVNVYPKEATWAIGSTAKYEIDYDNLQGQLVGQDIDKWTDFDVKTAKGFKDLAVRRLANVTVGTYPAGIEAYLPEGAEEADNYAFVFETAPLTITKGKIKLNLKNVNAEYNGKGDLDIAYDFEVADGSDLSEVLLDNDNWKSLIGTPENPTWNAQTGKWNIDFTLAARGANDGGRYLANKDYTIRYDANKNGNKDKMVATNYEVTVVGTDAKVHVDEAPIVVKVMDQEVPVAESVNKNVVNGQTVEVYLPNFKTGDNFDLKKIVAEKLTVNGNTLNLAVNKKDYGVNYAVTVEPGTWGLQSAGDLVLKSDASDWDKITKYNGKTFTEKAFDAIKLTLKQSEMKTNSGEMKEFEWAANEWHAMVLPFAAKVSEISAYFGYAIVNVVNPDGVSEGDVVFMMPEVTTMIPANTPFCVKTAKDVYTGNYESYTNWFELDREEGEPQYFVVTNPETKQVSVAADNGEFGYKFSGTYEEQMLTKANSNVRFLGPNSKWSKIGIASNAKFDMMPYTGYVELTGENATREVNFIFEEEDGSTTSIKAVDFMNPVKSSDDLYNVNGMKVQDASQKGIYIQNGKKFVVK